MRISELFTLHYLLTMNSLRFDNLLSSHNIPQCKKNSYQMTLAHYFYRGNWLWHHHFNLAYYLILNNRFVAVVFLSTTRDNFSFSFIFHLELPRCQNKSLYLFGFFNSFCAIKFELVLDIFSFFWSIIFLMFH